MEEDEGEGEAVGARIEVGRLERKRGKVSGGDILPRPQQTVLSAGCMASGKKEMKAMESLRSPMTT